MEGNQMDKQYESYKITYRGSHTPYRRETINGANSFADRLQKKGKHGEIEGVWFNEETGHVEFDLIRKF